MFLEKFGILSFAFINIFILVETLVEVPVIEENTISITASVIRSTVNNLFDILKFEGVIDRLGLKHFSTLHDFFVSITLTDYENLREIANLSRVNNINNTSQYFITQINEILNEGSKSLEENDNDLVTAYIDKFIEKLKYLKETYMHNRNIDINSKILRYIENGQNVLQVNITKDNLSEGNDYNENIISDNEYWRSSGRRIYHGLQTRIKKFPFLASVQFFKKFQCVGSIIKSDLVITSASCLQLAWNNRFFRENPAFLSVQVGSDYYEGGGDNIAVLEIFFHPNYDPKSLKNNLAIMRLTRKIIFTRKHSRVKKIEIDKNPWNLPSNTETITVIGWGAKESNNIIYSPFRNKLSYAELSFYPLSSCQDHYSREYVTMTNFCAGFISRGGGACNRDAGGPGIVDDILMGVVSFGSPLCGASDAPTVFTKLGYYAEWITDIMKQDVPNSYQPTTRKIPRTVPQIVSKTTTTRRTFVPINPTKKTIPTITTLTPTSTTGAENLRLGLDLGFKDFLSTMFGSDEIAEYFDTHDNDTKEVDDSEKERERSYRSNERVTLLDALDRPEIKLTKTLKPNTHSPRFSSLSNEIENVATVPAVIDNISNNEKSLEKDIMTLMDSLDLKELIKLDESFVKSNNESNMEKYNNKHQVIETSSESSERHLHISPKQESVLNFLFLSEENKEPKDVNDYDDDSGMSIQTESYNDLSFRHNTTKLPDVLSEKSLYELISLAIDEEAKRVKKKPYIL